MSNEDNNESFISHLEALRNTILKCLYSVAIVLPFTFFISPKALNWLLDIILRDNKVTLNYFSPVEVFLIQIKIAVLNHNQTFIDNNLTEEELLFSQIIRDADKLDIFYIWKDMEIDKVEGKIDDKIYNRMLTCEYDYENINNKLDYYVLLIGFVYDINFSWTIRYLKENKYFNTIIDKVIEKNPHESFRLNKIKETINQYIESRDA